MIEKEKKRKKMYFIILILMAILIAAFGQIFMKVGMGKLGVIELSEIIKPQNLFKILTNIPILTGISFYFMSLLIWLSLLSKFEVGSLYPLISLGYIVTAVFGILFLKEKFTFFKILGISLIILGSSLIIKH